MKFELPDLPYAPDALEPYISAQTLGCHHGKHHAAYVNKLNSLLASAGPMGSTLEEIMLTSAREPGMKAIFNNAAQAWNHAFYWQCMAPHGGGSPSGELGTRIAEDFHGFDNFRSEFRLAATNHFGSGWAWLVLDGDRLRVTTTSDAMSPLVQCQHALLTCDLWEHAYYLDYQNRRPDYLDIFLEKLVNWDFVARQLTSATGQAAAA